MTPGLRAGLVPARLLLLAATLLVAGGAVAAPPKSARDWLLRMNEALLERTYDGEFLRLAQGDVERFRILHRGAPEGLAERLVSLSGGGRELVRNEASVYCYLTDQRRLLVESHDTRGPLLGTLPAFNLEAMGENYAVVLLRGTTSLLGAPAQVVDVRPRDRHRFGYRLWLDSATYMPVRTDLYDADGHVLEQVLFVRLEFPHSIAPQQLRAAVDARGYTVETVEHTLLRAPAALPWGNADLPPGFRLVAAGEQVLPGGASPARHLVLSDGLATVSVFVEGAATRPAREGQGSVGIGYAMSVLVGGQRVTAIGEVPPETVRQVAAAVETASQSVR